MSTSTTLPTTGWEPDTPVEDTLLRRFVSGHTAWFETIARRAGGRSIRETAWAGADLGRPAGFFNCATLLRPEYGAALDATMARIESWFGDGEAFLWSPWPTSDLTARGWRLVGHPPLLFRPPGGPLPPAHPTLRVEHVSDGAGVRAWEQIVAHGFALGELQRRPGGLADQAILEDPRVGLWVGYDGSRPVTAGALLVEAELAYLAVGATLPEARRRGCWYAMVRSRLEAAGDRPAAALFSDMSRPGAELLGFQPLLRFTCWHRSGRG